jgi:hypothetical protein
MEGDKSEPALPKRAEERINEITEKLLSDIREVITHKRPRVDMVEAVNEKALHLLRYENERLRDDIRFFWTLVEPFLGDDFVYKHLIGSPDFNHLVRAEMEEKVSKFYPKSPKNP